MTGHRRSQPWRPRPFVHERSRAGKVLEPLLLVQLRRLSRRMWQLRHRPRDSHLRSKIGKQTTALLPRAPWLGELPYFEAEAWCEWLDDKIAAEAEDAKRQAIGKWRARLDASEANWGPLQARLATGGGPQARQVAQAADEIAIFVLSSACEGSSRCRCYWSWAIAHAAVRSISQAVEVGSEDC